jgi:hypothetical protein
MIFGIGHYNDEKQAEFVRHMVAAFQCYCEKLTQVEPHMLADFLDWSPHDCIMPGITTDWAADHVRRRRGLLLKIVHPGVAPTKAECALIDYPWDYILGVNGDDTSLMEDAQEFADWLCGHAYRPDQSAIARQAALQIEQDAIHDADVS